MASPVTPKRSDEALEVALETASRRATAAPSRPCAGSVGGQDLGRAHQLQQVDLGVAGHGGQGGPGGEHLLGVEGGDVRLPAQAWSGCARPRPRSR